MPLTYQDYDGSPVHTGYTWRIRDERRLSTVVARLMAGQARHIERVLRSDAAFASGLSVSTADVWIRRLIDPQPGTPQCYHRDGYLFQLISWIAALKTYAAEAILRAPQARQADKGIDGLLLVPVVSSGHQSSAWRIVVCEDKATENPRRTVKTEVWPALVEFEQGIRDHELMPEVTALLDRAALVDPVETADQLFREPRHYRVSLALDNAPTSGLFADYDVTVPDSHISQRRADYLAVPQPLRTWMQQFSHLVAEDLRVIAGAS